MTLDETSKQKLDNLIEALRPVVPKAFRSMSEEFPDLCGFAIGTTVYIEFVFPLCQSSQELPDDCKACFERFSPPEWGVMNDPRFGDREDDNFGDAVADARVALHDHCFAVDDDTSYEIRMAYLDSLLSLLVELEAQGYFGEKTDQRFLTLWVAADYEGKWIGKSSEKLNTATTHRLVLDEIG